MELNKDQRRLMDLISMSPGIKYSDLKKRSGMKNGSFSYNLNRLKEVKLVWRKRGRDGFGYEIVSKDKIADEVFLILVNKYLDGDMDKDTLSEFIERLERFCIER